MIATLRLYQRTDKMYKLYGYFLTCEKDPATHEQYTALQAQWEKRRNGLWNLLKVLKRKSPRANVD
jgi:hypothetical protein